jgi:hypothetical protein
MVFDYVVTKLTTLDKDEDGVETVIANGQLVANDKDSCLVKIGVELQDAGEVFDDTCKVLVRPF